MIRGSASDSALFPLRSFARVTFLGLKKLRRLRVVRFEFVRWQLLFAASISFPILIHCIVGPLRSFLPGQCERMLAAPSDLFIGSILFSFVAVCVLQSCMLGCCIANDMRRVAGRTISSWNLVERVASRFVGFGASFVYYAAVFVLIAVQYPEAACQSRLALDDTKGRDARSGSQGSLTSKSSMTNGPLESSHGAISRVSASKGITR